MQGKHQGGVWSNMGLSSFHQALLPMESQHMGCWGGLAPGIGAFVSCFGQGALVSM